MITFKLITTVILSFVVAACAQMTAQSERSTGRNAEAKDMSLVGYNDLQARSAYQPVIHHQGNRYHCIHRSSRRLGPKSFDRQGRSPMGPSLVDVTDPRNPRYSRSYSRLRLQGSEEKREGAQMVRVCDGKELARGDPNKNLFAPYSRQRGACRS